MGGQLTNYWLLGALLLITGLLLTRLCSVRRWHRNMDVSDDVRYSEMLATLSEGSVRRSFDPYTDIDWDNPEFSITHDDPRWVLSATDPFGRHPWYQAQPLEQQTRIGMWCQANLAKASLQLESILIRGLIQYTFRLPNGSPEYRYCMHETVEECRHSMMFQEMVNRIGADVTGMPRHLRWMSPLMALAAGPMPNVFFFGVLAGEVPIDHRQRAVLREDRSLHPLVAKVVAIHVAEEARHISFAEEYLRKRIPEKPWVIRLWISIFVPVLMRLLCQSTVPSRSSFKQIGIPRSVRKDLYFAAPDSRQGLRDMFADVRMLCHEIGLMNRLALAMWRVCGINGRPSRYRGEPSTGSARSVVRSGLT